MARKENRYGEKDVRPGHFQHGGGIGSLYTGLNTQHQISMPSYQDEYGMNREASPLDWSHDPRSEASYEKHYGKGPKDWLTDEKIQQRACEALYIGKDIDATEIEVSVEDRCVILRGKVDSREQKKAAERSVEDLPGVFDVRNELSIKQ